MGERRVGECVITMFELSQRWVERFSLSAYDESLVDPAIYVIKALLYIHGVS